MLSLQVTHNPTQNYLSNSAIPHLGIDAREMKKIWSYKSLYMNVHSSIIHNSQNVDMTQISINWWMDKQNAVYSWKGILLSYKEEWNICLIYPAI